MKIDIYFTYYKYRNCISKNHSIPRNNLNDKPPVSIRKAYRMSNDLYIH